MSELGFECDLKIGKVQMPQMLGLYCSLVTYYIPIYLSSINLLPDQFIDSSSCRE